MGYGGDDVVASCVCVYVQHLDHLLPYRLFPNGVSEKLSAYFPSLHLTRIPFGTKRMEQNTPIDIYAFDPFVVVIFFVLICFCFILGFAPENRSTGTDTIYRRPHRYVCVCVFVKVWFEAAQQAKEIIKFSSHVYMRFVFTILNGFVSIEHTFFSIIWSESFLFNVFLFVWLQSNSNTSKNTWISMNL